MFMACQKLKGRKFDLIFADPPYNLPSIQQVPLSIFENDLLTENGIAVIEHPASVDYSALPYFYERRKYGSVNFSLFRKKHPAIVAKNKEKERRVRFSDFILKPN